MMRECDKAYLDFLAETGNAMGWKPYCRDERGNAVLRAFVGAGASNPDHVRVCYRIVTEKGLLCHEERDLLPVSELPEGASVYRGRGAGGITLRG